MQTLKKQVPIWLFLVVVLATASIAAGLIIVPSLLSSSQDFQIQSNPTSQALLVGDGVALGQPGGFGPIYGEFKILVRSVNGFSGIVTMTVSVPSGLDASLAGSLTGNPAVVLGTNDTDILRVHAKSIGNYTVTITGTSGRLSHTVNVLVIAQDLGISVAQNPIMVPRGSVANTTVTIKSLNGISGNLDICCGDFIPHACGLSCYVNFTLFSPVLGCSPIQSSCRGDAYPLPRDGSVAMIVIATLSGDPCGNLCPLSRGISITIKPPNVAMFLKIYGITAVFS